MKKSAVILIVLLLLPLAAAVEVDMKSEFSQGETLIARISGNFIDSIQRENVFFYRGHVRVPMEFKIGKINEEFYIYALLPETQNNYTLSIEDASYMAGSKVSEEDIKKNFSVSANTADFSISPGFVITNEDFFIQMQNLQDSAITINIATETKSGDTGGFFSFLQGKVDDNTETEITLKSGEIEKVNFGIDNLQESTTKIIILSTENLQYEIPVSIFVNKSSPKEEKSFRFEPSELPVPMPTSDNATRTIYLYNTGEEKLENISLSISNLLKPYITLSIEEIDELDKDERIKIEIYFVSDSEEKILEGQITAKTDNDMYAYVALFLDFIKNYVPPPDGLGSNGEDIPKKTQTCDEMQGKECGENQKCQPETERVYARDNIICCLPGGTCQDIEDGNSTGKIIGWILIIILVAALIWFYFKKYKGTNKVVDLLKIGHGKK